ncbi:MAG TPA: DUF2970 domain-containing protein [Cellvibrionaceae bacterium]
MNLSENRDSQTDKPQKPGVLQIAFSTVAAAFGVQSSKNRERDFAGGNILSFIIAGVLFTAVFVGGLILLVNLLLRNV